MNGHTATGNGQATGVMGRNGHRERERNSHVVTPHALHASHLPTFVRLALLVRPWWQGVALNLTAALLNQGSGIALAVVTWPLAVVLLPFLVLVASLPLLGRRWVDPVAVAVRREHGQVNAHLVDSIQGLRELIAFGRGEARAAEVTEGSGRLGAAQQRYARFVGAVGGVTETCVALGSLAVLLTGASLVAAGTVNRYQLPLILVMAFAAFLPVMNVAVVARNLNQVAAAARRYFEVIDEPVLVLERVGMSPGTVPHVIAFDAVTFAYHPDEPP